MDKLKCDKEQQSVVAVCIKDGFDLLVCQIGILLSGNIYVPIDPCDPRLDIIIQDCKASLIIGEGDRMSSVASIEACSTSTEHSFNSDLTLVSHVFYTSGTTGTPKGVVVRRSSLWSFVKAKIDRSQIQPNSRVFLGSSFTFDPNYGDTFVGLCAGGVVCSAASQLIYQGGLHQCLRETKATHICLTPTVWNMRGTGLLEDLKDLKEVSLGGEQMTNEIIESFRGLPIRLVNTYGCTEATVYQATFCLDDYCVDISGGISLGRIIGNPYEGVCIGLREETSNTTEWYSNECAQKPVESTGKKRKADIQLEIVMKGDQVAIGYLNRDTLTKKQFVNGVYHTGDLGSWQWIYNQSSGIWNRYIRLEGRLDTQIKLRGVRIEVEEIESNLSKCSPLVKQAIIVKTTHNILVAYIEETHASSTKDGDIYSVPRSVEIALQSYCKKVLPQVYVPSRFVGISSLRAYTTPNGKVNRKALSSISNLPACLPLVAGVDSGVGIGSDDVLSPVEAVVAQIWAKILSINDKASIGPWDSFVQLGGDSLDAQRTSQALVETIFSNVVDDQVTNSREDCGWIESLREDSRTFGEIQGPFKPLILVSAPSLRQYVQILEKELQNHGSSLGHVLSVSDEVSTQREVRDVDVEKKALYVAAADGLRGAVEVFLSPEFKIKLSCDGDVDRNQRGKSPLHIACANDHLSVVKILLKAGANCFTTTSGKIPASHVAAANPGPNSCSILLLMMDAMRKRNVKDVLMVKDGRRQTLLHAAARGGNLETVEMLLGLVSTNPEKVQQRLHALDRWHRTPLHWAVLNGRTECVKRLVAAGSNPSFRVRPSVANRSTHLPFETALEIAVRKGFKEIEHILNN
mmetsp:Transcript_31123/g.49884  ORF Transcript_31123/g.49884 Transcript_31123/m.49884 type:complete len:858 (-) Transcript_31123:1688-4261(-)